MIKLDFDSLTIPVARWVVAWAQTKDDGVARELWVGTETESCLVGHASNWSEAEEALKTLNSMKRAGQVLRGVAT